MVGHYDSLDEYRTETLPARTGDAVIVQIWAGPGGNDLPGLPQPFPKAGEFFTSCSDYLHPPLTTHNTRTSQHGVVAAQQTSGHHTTGPPAIPSYRAET